MPSSLILSDHVIVSLFTSFKDGDDSPSLDTNALSCGGVSIPTIKWSGPWIAAETLRQIYITRRDNVYYLFSLSTFLLVGIWSWVPEVDENRDYVQEVKDGFRELMNPNNYFSSSRSGQNTYKSREQLEWEEYANYMYSKGKWGPGKKGAMLMKGPPDKGLGGKKGPSKDGKTNKGISMKGPKKGGPPGPGSKFNFDGDNSTTNNDNNTDPTSETQTTTGGIGGIGGLFNLTSGISNMFGLNNTRDQDGGESDGAAIDDADNPFNKNKGKKKGAGKGPGGKKT